MNDFVPVNSETDAAEACIKLAQYFGKYCRIANLDGAWYNTSGSVNDKSSLPTGNFCINGISYSYDYDKWWICIAFSETGKRSEDFFFIRQVNAIECRE